MGINIRKKDVTRVPVEVKSQKEVSVTVTVLILQCFFPSLINGVGYGNSVSSTMIFSHLKEAQRA